MNDAVLEELTKQIKQLTLETVALKRDLATFREDAATSQSSQGGSRAGLASSLSGERPRAFGVVIVIVVAIVATVVCAAVVWTVTKNALETTKNALETSANAAARQAIRDQMHGLKSFVQFGKFTAKNKVSDEPLAFDWILKTPVDPTSVVNATPELLGSPPLVAVSAEITQGGKACRMTVTGDTAALLEKMAGGLDAKVTILMDVDQLGSLQRTK